MDDLGGLINDGNQGKFLNNSVINEGILELHGYIETGCIIRCISIPWNCQNTNVTVTTCYQAIIHHVVEH